MADQITHGTDGGAADLQPVFDTSARLYDTVMDSSRANSTADADRTVRDSTVSMLDFGLEDVFRYLPASPKGPPSVKELIDHFDVKHAEKQVEVLLWWLLAPADKKDEYAHLFNDSEEWARRERIRLESLNTEDLKKIDDFVEAVKNGDFEKIAEIVKSLEDKPAYFGKLLRGINIELEREGLEKRFDVTASTVVIDTKAEFTTVTIYDLTQSPPKSRAFRTDGK